MAITIEEAVITKLKNDTDIQSFLGSNYLRKIYVAGLRPQQTDDLPNISISINRGPSHPRFDAMEGIVTILLVFPEKGSDGRPYGFSNMNTLKERVRDTLDKIDFSISGLTVNQFVLNAESEYFFNVTDKVWHWPLIYGAVWRDTITTDRF